MANTFFLAPLADFTSKTLDGAITDSASTITLNSTTNLTAPGYAVIDRQDSSGNNTPNSREVIFYTGISGNDLTGCSRGANNSTARAHSSGAIVEFSPTVGMWNNLATIVSSGLDSNGYLKALNSPVSVAQFDAGFLRASGALMSVVTITGHLNASGASVVGITAPLADPTNTPRLAVSSIASIAQLDVIRIPSVTIPSIASIGILHIGTHLNASAASISGSFLSSKVITASRDLSAANGNVAYTGVGFKPTSIFAFGVVSGEVGDQSIGFGDSAKGAYTIEGNNTPQGNLLYMTSSIGNAATADIASYDADGFTLTWTKVSSPTGTAQLRFICFR